MRTRSSWPKPAAQGSSRPSRERLNPGTAARVRLGRGGGEGERQGMGHVWCVCIDKIYMVRVTVSVMVVNEGVFRSGAGSIAWPQEGQG